MEPAQALCISLKLPGLGRSFSSLGGQPCRLEQDPNTDTITISLVFVVTTNR